MKRFNLVKEAFLAPVARFNQIDEMDGGEEKMTWSTWDAAMTRREILQYAGALGLGSLAAACGFGPTGTGNPTSSQTALRGSLTLLSWGGTDVFKDVVDLTKATYPDLNLNIAAVPFGSGGGYSTTLNTRMEQKDSSFDAYMVDAPTVQDRAARGYLVDLTTKLGNVKDELLAKSYETGLYKGKLFALPLWTSTIVLYYNIDLLKKAGLEPPGTDPKNRWTWEQTVDAARQAQKAGAKWGLLFEQDRTYYQLEPLPVSAGGGTGLKGTNLLQVDVTNQGWQEAFSLYGKLFADGVSPRGVPPFQGSQLFLDQKLVFYLGGPNNGQFRTAKSEGKLNYGFAPHPYFAQGKPVTPTDSWDIGINPYSQKQQLALDFIKYWVLNPDANFSSALPAFGYPVPPADKRAFDKWLKEQGRDMSDLVTHELTNTAVHRPPSVGFTAFETVLNLTTFPDISNGQDPTQALQKASDELNKQLEPLRKQLGGS